MARKDDLWRGVEGLVEGRQAEAYDQDIALLKRLHELALYQDALLEFVARLRDIRQRYGRFSFVERLGRAGPSATWSERGRVLMVALGMSVGANARRGRVIDSRTPHGYNHAMGAAARSPGPPGRVPLLLTKLSIPHVRQSLVPRLALLRRLDECLDHKLTLVSGPAGYGKTTLVSTWVRGLRIPIAWLSLDEADNDPVRFLSYLVAALQRANPTVGQDVRDALEASQLSSLDWAIGALVNDLAALSGDLLLVLDDFQAIDQAAIHEAAGNLVAHQPPQLHLAIITREDPPLPLARLRACSELGELRARDLRFTPEETSSLLRDVMGLTLEGRDLAELDARVEGWVAGLQLAGLSMRGHRDPADLIAALSGSHHFILSYLSDEVLRQLPPDTLSFLLQTCVLTRLSGPLCDAVTGRADSAAVLEGLCTANAFVAPLDDEHHWYRYHHLFAELLRSQLSHTQPQLAPTLQGRASEWYERQGMPAEAIDHALAAADYPRAVRLLETHAGAIAGQGHAQTVEGWLRRLPQEWRTVGPRANLAFAGSLVLRGQIGEAEPYLRNAEAAAAERERAGAHSEAAAILAEAHSFRAIVVSLRGDTEGACQLAQEAVKRAPQDDLYLQGVAHFSLGTAYNYAGKVVQAIDTYRKALHLCRAADNTIASMLIVANLALLYMARGQLRAAGDLCRQAIGPPDALPGMRSPALATVGTCYSQILYQCNELDEAHRQAERWLDLARRGGHVAPLASGSVALSRVLQAQGDIAGATSALDQAVRLLDRTMPAWVAPDIISQQVVLALARGDTAAARQALARTGVGVEDGTDYSREVIHIAYLRLLIHLGREAPGAGRLDQALAVAGRLLASAEPAGRAGRVIETLALRALAHQARGDLSHALVDLRQALALAEPEGYVRLFVNEGAPMAGLLKELGELEELRGDALSLPTYVGRLLSALGQEAQPAPPPVPSVPSVPTVPSVPSAPSVPSVPLPLVEPLSERELEVLRLMASGLSYKQVAQQLVVSLNTVRFHVKGIYGKLGVNKLASAIERARALDLL